MRNMSDVGLRAAKDGRDMDKDALRLLLMLLLLYQHANLGNRWAAYHIERTKEARMAQPRLGEWAYFSSHNTTYCETNAGPLGECAPSAVASGFNHAKAFVRRACLTQYAGRLP